MSALPESRRSPWRWLIVGICAGALPIAANLFLPWERARQIGTGVFALLLVLASAFYGARKWLFVARLGNLHAWMVGHVALGAALLVTILAHADLAELGGPGSALLGLVVVQLASGVWGVVEQKAAPRRYAAIATGELGHPTTVRRRLELLASDVDDLLRRRSPALREWFDARYRAALAGDASAPLVLEGFPPTEARSAAELHDRAAEIARLRAALARLEPAERASLRWTWIHVPATVALVTLVVLHVIGWLVYG